MADNDDFQFEKAFGRLEEILDKMNSSNASIDESFKLYEEGDRLIGLCSARLADVERRIEVLIKNRSGEVALDDEGAPQTEAFEPEAQGV